MDCRYVVQRRYFARRDGKEYGPWAKDTVVVLEPADAEWVNRDSAGVLAPQDEPEPLEETLTVDDADPDAGANGDAAEAGEMTEAAEEKPRRNRKHTPQKARS